MHLKRRNRQTCYEKTKSTTKSQNERNFKEIERGNWRLQNQQDRKLEVSLKETKLATLKQYEKENE